MTTMPVTIQERIPMPPAVGRRPAGTGTASLTFGDVVRILRQRIFLVILVWFFVTGLAGVATWWLQKHHQLFKSETLIKIESPLPKVAFETREFIPPVDLLNRYVADQVQIVKNLKVIDAALKDSRVIQTPWYAEHQGRHLEELQDGLDVTPVPNTSFLLVTFSTRNKADAPRIIDTVVDKYLGIVKSDSTSVYATELTNYKAQKDLLKNNLDRHRETKEKYIGEMIPTPGVAQGLNVPGEQWREIAKEWTRLEAEVAQLKAATDNYKSIDPNQITIPPQMRMNILQDPQVLLLGNRLLDLEQNLDTLLMRVGPRNRDVESMEKAIEVVRNTLDEVMRKKEQEIRDFQIQSTNIAFLTALQASNMLGERVSEFEDKQRDLDSKMARLQSMNDEQEQLERQLERTEDYVQQLEILVRGQETVRVSQVGKAVEPLRPSFPRWEMNMPVGSFLGLLMGVGLALLLELANTSIRTPRDLVRHVHTPILGTVPDLDDEEVAIERMELAAHTAPRSMIAEAFRTVRTNLLLSAPADRQRTVLITSSKPEEGKTSVAVNLAISIGQSGRRVLLIDANFHRPTLHTLFPHSKREGLSNILIGRGKLADLISPTELPNLDVLTCGPIPPNPTELLTSRHMAELINEAADRYDQVLFDGPPVLLVSDALVLASIVDGVILVCRAKTASRGTVQRAREQLERVNARIFGAVLNAAQVARGGYFREQMRSYYDYQPEEALLAGGTRALPREERPDNEQA